MKNSTNNNLESVNSELFWQEFEKLLDWQEKYAFLINLGHNLLPLDLSQKIPENKVTSCQARTWIVAQKKDKNSFILQGESDSSLIKGLLQLIFQVYENTNENMNRVKQEGEGKSPQAWLLPWLEKEVLPFLPALRQNGLRAILEKIETRLDKIKLEN